MSQCRHHAGAPGSQAPMAHSNRQIVGPSERLTAATPGRAPRLCCRMRNVHLSPLLSSTHLVRLLLESSLGSQCRHNTMAPGYMVAGSSERLLATSVRHNTTGASP